MNARDRKRLEATAYHEAGHAVAAAEMGVPFRYVSIIPNLAAGSAGHLQPKAWGTTLRPDVNDSLRVRARVENDTIVCLAGPAATKRWTGRHDRHLCASDYERAADNALRLCAAGAEADAYLAWLTIRARNSIESPMTWSKVQAVAAELLTRKRLAAAEVRRIMRRVHAEAFALHTAKLSKKAG